MKIFYKQVLKNNDIERWRTHTPRLHYNREDGVAILTLDDGKEERIINTSRRFTPDDIHNIFGFLDGISYEILGNEDDSYTRVVKVWKNI